MSEKELTDMLVETVKQAQGALHLTAHNMGTEDERTKQRTEAIGACERAVEAYEEKRGGKK